MKNSDETPAKPVINPSDPRIKEALKEAIHEWLDEQFVAFGKFSLYGLIAAAFAGLVYLAVSGLGYHR